MAQKNISKKAIALHKKLRGKVRVIPSTHVKNRRDLSLIYTPGVAAVSTLLTKNPKLARDYTIKGRMVAVISDGTAVLGLGNIGPYGALPVMEGKAALFKTFADVDAFPIVLDTSSVKLRGATADEQVDYIVQTICTIAPAFGGINLEDFAAPQCFEIERRLKEALDIPVIHDDQHGTAIVVLAALTNAAKVVGKKLASLTVVVSGAGAAGTAIIKLLHLAGIRDIVVLDSKGILSKNRADIFTSAHKKELLGITNPRNISGDLSEALTNADVLIGVSGPNLAQASHIRRMAPKAIVFAMANPTPEIMPEEAKKGGAVVIATGRSDYANQVNNSLAFPGIFRGALDHQVSRITDAMKLAAAKNLASLVARPAADYIIPDLFDTRVSAAVARAIR